MLLKTAFLNYVCEVSFFRNLVGKFSCMKKQLVQLFLVLLCLKSTLSFGQYTEVINSNRPGFSESPYSVGTGVYQLETSLFYRNTEINSLFTRPEAIGLDFLLRSSFFKEQLEINSNIRIQQDKVTFTNIFQSSFNQTAISQFSFAAKYLVYQPSYKDPSKEVRSWKRKFNYDYSRLIPSVAIYAGVNTNEVSEYYKLESITPKIGILLQQNFTPDFNLINNFFYDNIGSQFNKYTYILTGTQNFGNRISSFFEYKGDFYSFRYDHNIGAGLAYLFSKDLQFNASGRFLVEGKTTGFFTSIGASYRIDKHKDSFKDLDRVDYLKEETPIEKYNRKQNSFFKRILGSKKEKKRKKVDRKRVKTKKRKAKKRKPEKEKKKKKKKEETEIEKLEREIKELEKEMKKGGNN
jgi:hypothetical protein